MCFNRKVYDQCVLPVQTYYGAETEAQGCANKLRTTQRAMELWMRENSSRKLATSSPEKTKLEKLREAYV